MRQLPNTQSADLRVSSSAITRFFLGIIVALTIAHLVANAVVHFVNSERLNRESDVIQIFDFDFERNFPTWYQGMTLALCGLILILIGVGHRQRGNGRFGFFWFLLGAIFAGLSVDELSSIHEQSIVPMQNLFEISGGPLLFAWVIPAIVLLILLVIILIPFLRELPRATLNQFIVAGAVYVGGAVGMEMAGGVYVGDEFKGDTFAWLVMTTIEELLEMFGILLFIRALMRYIGSTWDSLSITPS